MFFAAEEHRNWIEERWGLRSAHRPRNVRHRFRLREVMRVLPVAGPQQIVPRRRTSSTELHWISRPDDNAHRKPGEHEYAVIGRDLGDRDWAAIDPLPLRKSKGLRFRFTPSLYFWQPTGTHVWCESQEERWEVLWLEYSGQVERLWAQPMAITFGHGSRLSGYSHFPDLMALFTDGSYGLLDVRPADRVDDAARVQFAETATACDALGWRYRVLTGHDKRATGNLDSLSASRHDRCRPGRETEVLILSAARGGRSRGDLCQIASPDCPPLACAWVDNLAWRRLLHVDLGGVFSSETVYTTTEAALAGAAA